MSTVKLWNRNVHPFSQDFRGEKITIPAGGYIEMDYSDAVAFKSKLSPVYFNGQGVQDPKSYKMLEVDGLPSHDITTVAFKSHIDGSLHATKEARDAYEVALTKEAGVDTDGAKIVRGKPKITRAELGA